MSEDIELLRLRAKAKLKLQQQESKPEVETALTDDQAGHIAPQAAILESIPFGKDVVAGVGAIPAIFDEEQTFGEAYTRNMKELNHVINTAEEKNPAGFYTTEVATGLAVPWGSSLKGAMALGSLSALSRSEDRDVWDAASGAALGAAGHGVGQAIGYGVNKLTQGPIKKLGLKLGLIADETSKDAIGGVNASARRKINEHIRKHYSKGGELTDQEATRKFAEKALKIKVGKESLIAKGDDIRSISFKSRKHLKNIGDKFDKLLKENDRPLTDDEVMGIYNSFKNELTTNIRETSSTLAQKKRDNLLSKLDEEFFEKNKTLVDVEEISDILDNQGKPLITKSKQLMEDGTKKLKKMTLRQLHGNKVFYGQEGYKTAKDMSAVGVDTVDFYKTGSRTLNNSLEELLETSSLKAVNKEYADALMLNEISTSVANKVDEGAMGVFKDALSLRMTLLAGAALGGFNGSAGRMAAGAALGGLIKLSKDPTTPANMAVGLRKLSDRLTQDVSGKIIDGAMLGRLAAASALPIDKFRTELAGMASETILSESEIERTSEDVIAKSDDILNVMEAHDSGMAAQLRAAIDDDDRTAIGTLMDSISKIPQVKSIIAPGTGWDGKVYDPQEKANMAESIKYDMSISRSQRNRLINDLMENGTMPQPQPEQPTMREWRQRNKRVSEY